MVKYMINKYVNIEYYNYWEKCRDFNIYNIVLI